MSAGLEKYEAEVYAFVETLLRPYITAARGTHSWLPSAPKEFNDPVWGTLVLHPHEVIVLDSPLMQRLRRIRQLGVAHWVYPAAVHTRFEHSLGVCHQVQRLSDSINSHATADGPLLDSETVRLMRLTGLCHDIGHGLMSHVVENSLRNDRKCQDLVLDFGDVSGRDGKNQLSEIAAHYMLRSPAFSELLELAYRHCALPYDDEIPAKMSRIVIGEMISDSMPLLHELISGPFDADKLDYMPRDAAMCGVPTVTDIERLIQKVRAVRVPEERLPRELAEVVETGEKHYTVVGLAPSGASTLDEVSIGRSLMFDKIYRHQKVRAAELMVAAVIDQIGDFIEPYSPMLPLRICDDELLSLSRESLSRRNPHVESAGEHGATAIEVGLDIVARLSQRHLFMRAFAFSQHMPRDPYRGDPEHRHSLEKMIRLTSESETRKAYVDEVVKLIRQMSHLVPDSIDLSVVPSSDPTPYIWVDPPAYSIPDTKPDPNRAYLIDREGRPHRVDEVNAETRGWSDAYVNTHDMGYVFTIREFVPAVSLASEIAAYLLYGVRISSEMQVYSKQDPKVLASLVRKLDDAGFYTNLPYDLRPPAPVLRRVDKTARVAQVVARLQGYSGPVSTSREGALTESSFNAVRVENWVNQFAPEFVDLALKTAEAIQLIGRPETGDSVRSFFARAESARFAHGSVVPLGQPKDGSAVVGYNAGDAARELGCQVRDLSDALLNDEPLIFVDDFVGRGSETISILEALLGVEDTQHLNEARPQALAPRFREELRERPVAFVYTAGLDGAQAVLEEHLARLRFRDSQVFVHLGERHLASLTASVLRDAGGSDGKFKAECDRIGRQLLEDGESRHDDNWRAERALGYGNHGLLLVFPYNTPTATLTALWKQGKVDGKSWRPLLPRRAKR